MHHDTPTMGIDPIYDTTSLERATAFVILRFSRLLRYQLNKFLTNQGTKITPEQWFTLFRLHEKDGQFQTELTDKTLNDRPNITRMLDTLVREDLVTRNPDAEDRRKYRIFLTDHGRDIVMELLPKVIEERKRIFRGVSPKELEALKEILKKIESNL